MNIKDFFRLILWREFFKITVVSKFMNNQTWTSDKTLFLISFLHEVTFHQHWPLRRVPVLPGAERWCDAFTTLCRVTNLPVSHMRRGGGGGGGGAPEVVYPGSDSGTCGQRRRHETMKQWNNALSQVCNPFHLCLSFYASSNKSITSGCMFYKFLPSVNS